MENQALGLSLPGCSSDPSWLVRREAAPTELPREFSSAPLLTADLNLCCLCPRFQDLTCPLSHRPTPNSRKGSALLCAARNAGQPCGCGCGGRKKANDERAECGQNQKTECEDQLGRFSSLAGCQLPGKELREIFSLNINCWAPQASRISQLLLLQIETSPLLQGISARPLLTPTPLLPRP